MEYLDFDVEIGIGDGLQYPLSVRSPAGEARGTMNFPYDRDRLELHMKDLEIALLRSASITRLHLPSQLHMVQQMGMDFYNSLFTGDIRTLYDVSKHIASSKKMGLRIRLRIHSSELSALPWEYLYDPHACEYLCLSNSTPLVRYLEVEQPVRPIAVTLPLRVLGMVCSPSNLLPLDVEEEKSRVNDALADLIENGLVELVWLKGETWTDLQAALLEESWHIFHFIGHGNFNADRDEGYLAFKGPDGKAQNMHATELARLLADHRDLRIVVLNACKGAYSSWESVFSSTASVLVRRGIACTIAMQFPITDNAAVELSKWFYTMLAKGLPVDAALTEARKALSITAPNSVEWGTPVIFMRSPDGTLFKTELNKGQLSISKANIKIDKRKVDIPNNIDILQTYGVNLIEELNIRRRWHQIPEDSKLIPFPISLGNKSQIDTLSLHLAQNYDGPNGIIAGTTGSGKSELLKSLICALAIEHHPYFVNFLLLDFKGGSTFGVFRNLPHTVGLVSNLDIVAALRFLEAIKAENLRRQRLLGKMCVEDIQEYYEEINRIGSFPPNWTPLPHLFIIIDEFAQIARELPSFLPELFALLRVGRTLGLHLILATQRPAGVVSDEMRSNLNFRIALRVQTVEDSLDILSRPDAAKLPVHIPGRAFFQIGNSGSINEFQTAQVNVAYTSKDIIESKTNKNNHYENKSLLVLLVEEMQQLVKEIKMNGLEAILLDPLLEFIPLFNIIEEGRDQYSNWFQTENGPNEKIAPQSLEAIRIPVGKIDNIAEHSQPILWLNFQGKEGGHVLILGGPQSGKTSFLRTLAYSAAYSYTPEQLQIYAISFASISFAGRGLDRLTSLPHVGDVIHGNENERLMRLIRRLKTIIENRKSLLGDYQVNNFAEYNYHQTTPLPAIIVLIDNFHELTKPIYSVELEEIEKLIENGYDFGVFFVVSAYQLENIPYKLMSLFEQRLALKLTEPTEYKPFIGYSPSLEAEIIPPGRGFLSGPLPLMFQLAVVNEQLNAEEVKMVNAMISAWQDRARPIRIEILNKRVNLSTILSNLPSSLNPIYSKRGVVPIGVDGDTLEAFTIDWSLPKTHLLVGGPAQSGRTSTLHTLVLSIANTFSPDEAWFILVDGMQGSLRPLLRLPHIISWVTEEDSLSEQISHLQEELEHRREYLRDHNSIVIIGEENELPFPHIFFVVDDYELTRDIIAFDETILALLSKTIRRDYGLNFHMIVSCTTQHIMNDNDPVIKQLKLARSGVSLVNVDILETLGGRITSDMHRQNLINGRGYAIIPGTGPHLIQIAFPDIHNYNNLQEKWSTYQRSKWLRPAASK